MLRPGNAGSFTACDHIAVLDAAFGQIPATWRTDVLVSIDGAGASHEIIDHLTSLNTAAVHGKRGRRVPERATPQVDEHVIRVQRPVLAVQVVGIQPHQPGAGRDHPGPARLGPRPVVVDPRRDRDLPLGDPEVLVAKPERLPDPQPGVQQHREQQPVPQPGAAIQDRLRLRRGNASPCVARSHRDMTYTLANHVPTLRIHLQFGTTTADLDVVNRPPSRIGMQDRDRPAGGSMQIAGNSASECARY